MMGSTILAIFRRFWHGGAELWVYVIGSVLDEVNEFVMVGGSYMTNQVTHALSDNSMHCMGIPVG